MGKLKERIRQYFFEESWNIGLIRDLNAAHLFQTRQEHYIQWLKAGRGYFLADPFVLDAARGLIVCEYYHFYERVGKLAILRVGKDNTIADLKILPVFSRHLSYPFVVDLGTEWGIIPETALDHNVRLIRLSKETLEVTAEKVLLDQYSGVDPSVFYHDGQYWMASNPLGDFDRTTDFFVAPSIEGPWSFAVRHSIREGRRARSAGVPFHYGKRLYRLTQYNDSTYGGGIIVKEITRLGTGAYEEETVNLLVPDPNSPFPAGMHTLSIAESMAVTDGKKIRFSPLKPLKLLCGRCYRFFYFRNDRNTQTARKFGILSKRVHNAVIKPAVAVS